jgi:hypothetical protein
MIYRTLTNPNWLILFRKTAAVVKSVSFTIITEKLQSQNPNIIQIYVFLLMF